MISFFPRDHVIDNIDRWDRFDHFTNLYRQHILLNGLLDWPPSLQFLDPASPSFKPLPCLQPYQYRNVLSCSSWSVCSPTPLSSILVLVRTTSTFRNHSSVRAHRTTPDFPCQVDLRVCEPDTCYFDGEFSLHSDRNDFPSRALGTCVPISPTEYQCLCIVGRTGRHCEDKIDYCHNVTCQNNALCQSTDTGAICRCLSASYTGPNCEFTTDGIVIRRVVSRTVGYRRYFGSSRGWNLHRDDGRVEVWLWHRSRPDWTWSDETRPCCTRAK